MPTPKPGIPVRGSSTGRPIMVLLDLLGRRWVLRILWELRDGPLTFRMLRERCDDVSPTTLNARLKELRESGLVELLDDGYAMTETGSELAAKLVSLTGWADRWAESLDTQKEDRT
ncbi:MAG: winged helix-turn-helix transcriptional regulator [Minwuia sp.]|uniref:winged helix-turn-helix transcriptional regulator n=1 Tax=Minwuia sp. TaxID=2493630 RepID=UPI003A891C0F